ncbi:hypothetical protein GRX03_12810 [Halovenus sp. WSH3]|uniref:Glycyl aminopeptidase n=1 Tax=Halovenus carboxidivorans TaxID=2692199 RepID=A0A6B0TA62_9EURY|nr:hypothetical protein [Halovenus carboxidivorans]MXR52483.1 hypothetical protein [Halovenus carboxidivorans]
MDFTRASRGAAFLLLFGDILVLSTGGAAADSSPEDPKLVTDSTEFDTERGAQEVPGETTITLTQELARLPEQRGQYLARHRYEMPTEAALLRVTLPASSVVRSADGFVREDDHTYRWDGTTRRPTLAYAVQANESLDRTGPIAGPGRLVYADVGAWGVVSQPATGHSWGWREPDSVGFERETVVDGPGAAGDVMAYLGAYEEFTHNAHGQRFRLIVPAAASLSESPAALFDSLSAASDELRVGDRDETVFVIATPSDNIDWGVRGLQTGPADMWVRDRERLADADNVWLHEYVHTRQNWAAASDLGWLTEGGATYYAALLSLDQGSISFERFRRRLAVGTSEQFGGSILADPATWQGTAQYHVGALVAGELDRRIRRQTASNKSLQAVFRRFNGRATVLNRTDLQSVIAETAGETVAARAERWTTTTDRPAMWDQAAHETAFAEPPEPARITLSTADDRVDVSGPYRDRRLAEGEPVVPGETVRFAVLAENFGGRPGTFTARLFADGSVVSTTTGTLDAGEQRRIEFAYTFTAPGPVRLAVGERVLDVQVIRPATPTVESLSVNRSTISAGAAVRLSATVTNEAAWPAAGSIGLTRDGRRFTDSRVRLDGTATEEVSVVVRIEEPGTYTFGSGNTTDTVAVTVEPASADDSTNQSSEQSSDDTSASAPSTDDSGDGNAFGPVAVPVVMLGLLLGARLSRRSSS